MRDSSSRLKYVAPVLEVADPERSRPWPLSVGVRARDALEEGARSLGAGVERSRAHAGHLE
jgi:hypothetical protein